MVGAQNRMQGGMFRSGQQGNYLSQARGMPGHYQGNVVIAGGQGVRRSGDGDGGVYRSGSVGSAGQVYAAGLRGVATSSRSQSFSSGSAGQHGQMYTQQQRAAYQQSVPHHQ